MACWAGVRTLSFGTMRTPRARHFANKSLTFVRNSGTRSFKLADMTSPPHQCLLSLKGHRDAARHGSLSLLDQHGAEVVACRSASAFQAGECSSVHALVMGAHISIFRCPVRIKGAPSHGATVFRGRVCTG